MKVFIGSTSFDLIDSRSEIIHFLKEECNVIPIHFESDNSEEFQRIPNYNSHDQCIHNVSFADRFILIIDKRWGGDYCGSRYPDYVNYNGMRMSVTWAEAKYAYDHHIPVHTFVRTQVWDERPIYKKNKENGYQPVHCDDTRIFDFIDFITHQPENNWIDQFTTVVDLKPKILNALNISRKFLVTKTVKIQSDVYKLKGTIPPDILSMIETGSKAQTPLKIMLVCPCKSEGDQYVHLHGKGVEIEHILKQGGHSVIITDYPENDPNLKSIYDHFAESVDYIICILDSPLTMSRVHEYIKKYPKKMSICYDPSIVNVLLNPILPDFVTVNGHTISFKNPEDISSCNLGTKIFDRLNLICLVKQNEVTKIYGESL